MQALGSFLLHPSGGGNSWLDEESQGIDLADQRRDRRTRKRGENGAGRKGEMAQGEILRGWLTGGSASRSNHALSQRSGSAGQIGDFAGSGAAAPTRVGG